MWRDCMGETGGSRGVIIAGTNCSSGSLVLISISSAIIFDEVGGSRDIVGISSLLFDLGRSVGREEVGCCCVDDGPLLLRVFVRDVRVAANREREFSRSRTKEFVSGSKTSTNSFAFASCMGPLKI